MPLEARYHEQVRLLVSLLPFLNNGPCFALKGARPSTSSCSHYPVYRSISTLPTCRWSPVTRHCDAVARRCSDWQRATVPDCQACGPSFRIIAEDVAK